MSALGLLRTSIVVPIFSTARTSCVARRYCCLFEMSGSYTFCFFMSVIAYTQGQYPVC